MKTLHFLIYLTIGLLLSGCYSQYQHHTAKTTKPKEILRGGGMNIGGSSNFNYQYPDADSIAPHVLNGPWNLIDVQSFIRTGLTNNQDIGLTVGLSSLSVGLDYKIMLIGNHESKFVLSPGLGIKTNRYKTLHFPVDLEIPIHISYYFNDKAALFFTPIYILERGSYEFLSGTSIHRLGFSSGAEYKTEKINFLIGINKNWAVNNEIRSSSAPINFFSFNLGISKIF